MISDYVECIATTKYVYNYTYYTENGVFVNVSHLFSSLLSRISRLAHHTKSDYNRIELYIVSGHTF